MTRLLKSDLPIRELQIEGRGAASLLRLRVPLHSGVDRCYYAIGGVRFSKKALFANMSETPTPWKFNVEGRARDV